jgi:hypothetical protein
VHQEDAFDVASDRAERGIQAIRRLDHCADACRRFATLDAQLDLDAAPAARSVIAS